MRKLLNTCLLFVLLFSTSGVAISKHYCGEILQKITLKGQEKSCCEGQEMPEGCCSEEVSIIKSDDLKLSQQDINIKFTPFILYILEDYISIKTENDSHRSFLSQKYHSPPGPDIVILVQSFLI